MSTTRQIKVDAPTTYIRGQGWVQNAQSAPSRPALSARWLAFALLLALAVGVLAVAYSLLKTAPDQAVASPTPASVPSAPIMDSSRPQEDAPTILAVVTPAVIIDRVSDQGVTQPAAAHQPRVSVRGGPLPGATTPAADPPQRVEVYHCAWPNATTVSIAPGIDPYRVERHGNDMWLWRGAGTIGDPNFQQCRLQDVWEPFVGTWNGRGKP